MAGGVALPEWVDFALEVPTLLYYKPPIYEDCPPKLSMTNFYPTMHSHGGGCFKVALPRPGTQQRERMRDANPRSVSAQRAHKSLLQMARAGAELADITFYEVLHLLAQVVVSVNVYHAPHHNMACVLSNTIPTTIGGVRARVEECREAQLELAGMIDKHQRGYAPRFANGAGC